MLAQSDPISKEQRTRDYDDTVTPLPERISDAFGIHYLPFWGTAGIVFIIVHTVIICAQQGVSPRTVLPSVTLAALPSALIIAGIQFSKILERFTPSLFSFLSCSREKCEEWYSAELRAIFSERGMALSGLILAVPLLLYAYQCKLAEGYPSLSKASFMVVVAAMAFAGGGVYYARIRLLMMLWKFGSTQHIRISISQHPQADLMAIGHVMMQVSWTTLVIYLIGISCLLVVNAGMVGGTLALLFAAVEIALFIVPQLRIHLLMVEVKQKKLRAFAAHLEKALNEMDKAPSKDCASKLRELFAIQSTLNEMDDWPFNRKEAISWLSGIVIPAAPFLAKIWPDLQKYLQP